MSQNASINLGKPDAELWIACGSCDRVTHHKALAVVEWREDSEGGELTLWQSYMIVICQGCRTVSFCIESAFSEDIDYDPYTGDSYIEKTYKLYPSRVAGRPVMDSIHEVPLGIGHLYHETRNALCNDQPILAGIGIRAIVEAVCNDRGATGKTLENRIDGLAAMKIVTDDGAKILHSLRFMGNAAAHEVKAHNIQELSIAFGVVEYLLHGVYVMPKQAAKLPKAKPAP